jgi:hypothetical protein
MVAADAVVVPTPQTLSVLPSTFINWGGMLMVPITEGVVVVSAAEMTNGNQAAGIF